MNKITAQIAVEAIINNPSAFDAEDIEIVRQDAIALGVSRLYLKQLPGRGGDWWNK